MSGAQQRKGKAAAAKAEAETVPAAALTHSKSEPVPGAKGLLINEEPTKKWRSAWVRTYTTLLMLGGFIMLLMMGHLPLVGLLVACQIAMFKEVKRLSKVLSTQTDLPSFRPLHWTWFFTAMFFSYGRVLASYFHYHIPYHSFISFALYMMGVVVFVLSLESGYYKYQFEMFAWVQLTLFLIVVQSTVIVVNMFSGLIWFILPALLIISNDTFAYIFGFFFGRTPLISLSPKKTWEGFIGAFFSTLLVGFLLSRFLCGYELMVCPKEDLTMETPHCTPGLPYIPVPWPVPEGMRDPLARWFGGDWTYMSLAPMQWHGLALALFASIIAPFGGFFASGFKRAFGIKDFGESIPGHGGVTDRMDCQIMMGLFVFVYYQTFVLVEADVHANFVRFQNWEPAQQIEYYQRIQDFLTTRGIIKI